MLYALLFYWHRCFYCPIILQVRFDRYGGIQMSQLATTKLSSKGQVVIPEEVRNSLDLHAGAQFLVVSDNKDTVVLKVISAPSMDEFDSLIKKARSDARRAGLTKSAVKDAIKAARKHG
jgi:AbrB family looped-hinge helix DNA binding protein